MLVHALPVRAAVVCDQECRIEYRDGLFIVDDPNMPLIRAYTPTAFFRSFQGAAKVLQAYHADEADDSGADIVVLRERA